MVAFWVVTSGAPPYKFGDGLCVCLCFEFPFEVGCNVFLVSSSVSVVG